MFLALLAIAGGFGAAGFLFGTAYGRRFDQRAVALVIAEIRKVATKEFDQVKKAV